MIEGTKLGPWVRRFLLEYLVGERNLARNTQRSYRDALALLLLSLLRESANRLISLQSRTSLPNKCDSSCKTWSKRGVAAWQRVING